MILNDCAKEFSLVSLLTISYYRIIAITFGGITTDRRCGKFVTNYSLKIYGIIAGIGNLSMSLFVSYSYANLPEISELRESGTKSIYYLIIFWCIMINIQLIINILYLNKNVLILYKIVYKYPINKKKHLAIFYTLFFTHIIVSVLSVVLDILSVNKYQHLLCLWSFIHKLFQIPIIWCAPFLTWAISMGEL